MQLDKNKILVSSAVYIASLAVAAAMFGLWHNAQLKNGNTNHPSFIVFTVLIVLFLSWFYYIIFNAYRKKIEEKTSMEPDVETELLGNELAVSEEKTTESFNKEDFIAGILPANKTTLNIYCEEILLNLAKKLNIVQGLFYIKPKTEETFEPIALYAYYSDKKPSAFIVGEGLPGQAIKDKRVVIIQNIPENYVPVVSGLGTGKPKNLLMLPVLADNEPVGLIEVTVFSAINYELEPTLKELGGIIGKNIIKLMK